jgi:hypothetical protein
MISHNQYENKTGNLLGSDYLLSKDGSSSQRRRKRRAGECAHFPGLGITPFFLSMLMCQQPPERLKRASKKKWADQNTYWTDEYQKIPQGWTSDTREEYEDMAGKSKDEEYWCSTSEDVGIAVLLLSSLENMVVQRDGLRSRPKADAGFASKLESGPSDYVGP